MLLDTQRRLETRQFFEGKVTLRMGKKNLFLFLNESKRTL